MGSYQPPFSITPEILHLSQQIFRKIGRLEGQKLTQASQVLRRENRIKTIQASLAIEGNTLDLEQVTDLLNGKRVLGPVNDILEVKNAALVYDRLHRWNPILQKDLLKAHQLLMGGLVAEMGEYRSRGVGIFKGGQVAHMAPPAKRVPELMGDLFKFIASKNNLSWMLKSCVFHYEFEFIHPFVDGNGRMGRLWQQLLLIKEHPVFEYVSIEEIIKKNQLEYYDCLAESDQAGDSTSFVVFSLKSILTALSAYGSQYHLVPNTSQSRLEYSKTNLEKRWFSRQDYLKIYRDISTATASRDLAWGAQQGLLHTTGSRNQRRYQFAI